MNFLSIFSLVLLAYVTVSLLWWMPISRGKKVALFLFFLLISQKYTFFQIFGTGPFNPSLPFAVMAVWEGLFNILLVLLNLLVLKDIVLLVCWILKKVGIVIRWPFNALQVKSALILMAMVAGPWGVYSALSVPDVHRIEVSIKGLDPTLDGYRIVQLTDLHIGQLLKRPWLEKVVAKTNTLRPDMIVMTGDMIEGGVKKLHDEVAPYGALVAKDGIFAVTGNHEYYHGKEAWIERLESMGIMMLENRHHVIERGDARLVVAGVTDKAARRQKLGEPDLEKALPTDPQVPIILLSHQPMAVESRDRVDLQLSGHTHGGLIATLQPLVGFFNGGFVDGLYRLGERTQLYVSPGTGLWTGMACRIGVSSEITEIVLRSEQ